MSDKETIQTSNGEEVSAVVKNLNGAIDSTVNRCIVELRYSNLAKSFPTFHKSQGKRLKHIQEELTTQLKAHIREEVDLLFTQYDVSNKINELAILKKKIICPGKSWRPSGDVDEDIRAHLIEQKMDHVSELKEILKKQKKKNKELKVKLHCNKRSLENLTYLVNKKLDEYQNIQIMDVDPNKHNF